MRKVIAWLFGLLVSVQASFAALPDEIGDVTTDIAANIPLLLAAVGGLLVVGLGFPILKSGYFMIVGFLKRMIAK